MRTTRAIMDPDYRTRKRLINEVADDFVPALEKDPYEPRGCRGWPVSTSTTGSSRSPRSPACESCPSGRFPTVTTTATSGSSRRTCSSPRASTTCPSPENGAQVRQRHGDGQRDRLRNEGRQPAGSLGPGHRAVPLRGRLRHQLQRDGGRGTGLRPLPLQRVGLPRAAGSPGLGHRNRAQAGRGRSGDHGRDPAPSTNPSPAASAT